MLGTVIRCPACGGRSRTDAAELGALVLCPWCSGPFVAEAVPDPADDEFPPHDPPPPRRSRPAAEPPPPADDPPPDADTALPGTVFVGLALLPFVIPLLWLIGPSLAGHDPLLSLAAPLALAVTASALCLAVVSTVDWTPATRLKGVLILVGLSYFTGLFLFFLKADAVDWLEEHFGPDGRWAEVQPPNGGFGVRVPGGLQPIPAVQPVDGWDLECYRCQVPKRNGREFVAGFGQERPFQRGWPVRMDNQAWFERVRDGLLKAAHVKRAVSERAVATDDPTAPAAREWEVRLPGGTTRVIRVVRVDRRLYYLAAEGPDVHPRDDDVRLFLDSFRLKR